MEELIAIIVLLGLIAIGLAIGYLLPGTRAPERTEPAPLPLYKRPEEVVALFWVALAIVGGALWIAFSPSIGQRLDAYRWGPQWKLMLTPPGQAILVESHASRESCEAERAFQIKTAFTAYASLPPLACVPTESWWIRVLEMITRRGA